MWLLQQFWVLSMASFLYCQVSKGLSLIPNVWVVCVCVLGEGRCTRWQLSFSDGSVLKRKTAGERSAPPHLHTYIHRSIHIRTCVSLAVSHLRWHLTAGMAERRGCVYVCICACVREEVSNRLIKKNLISTCWHIYPDQSPIMYFVCLQACEEFTMIYNKKTRHHILPLKIFRFKKKKKRNSGARDLSWLSGKFSL